MRSIVAAFVAVTLVAAGAPALAAPCKDAKTGKFVKCPTTPVAKATKCRDAKGKFAKCSAPGAKPVK
ncbi:hypothetical protein [uncultured Sphingomonas sp.]|mgnify:CR=1 FL=1|uniref:hypothetical protein n=1 Tax=uncultured Sphingomonas sp. TaxID=158754 RepID=UPI0026367DED|nr:hypothetical protein [uncultured Sphingomonas sp.]